MHCIYCRERKRQVPGPKYTPRQKSCVHRLTQGLTLFLTHHTSFVFCSSSHGASTYLKALVCAVMCCNPLFSKALGMYCLSRPLRPLSRPLVPCLQTLRSTPWFTALCLGTCHVSEQFSRTGCRHMRGLCRTGLGSTIATIVSTQSLRLRRLSSLFRLDQATW